MRTYINNINNLEDGSIIEIDGWVQEIRKIKKLLFLIVRDNTESVQVTVKDNMVKNYDSIYNISRESVIKVSGKLNKKSISKSGVEILANEIIILNTAETPLPMGVIDLVDVDFDTRLNNRFIDLRKPENLIIFKFESELLFGIREYMNKNNFIEVHTPKIVAAATEGGADLFPVQYFEKRAYLNQSPQLYKEILMSSGFDRVFEVGPAFRAEKENTVRHLNEFTSIDIEMSFSDDETVMRMLENAIAYSVNRADSILGKELKGLGYSIEEVRPPFPRIEYSELINYLNDNGFKLNFGDDFSPEAMKFVSKKYNGFYFITKWPKDLRPFYTMPDDTNRNVTRSFDLQLRDIEVCSGAQRIHDYNMLENSFNEKGLNKNNFEFYIKAFKYGMPPHAGWGLGLERLVMNLLNLSNVRESTLFPRDRSRLSP
ncbi:MULTISPECIES: aspartate--tRNA(Asn) ligase [unclassified Acidiplasma]|uniref:aspartate--tRNA(Asn) ligase n=1 Tax=unclassified Acidiplasma TaxID=2641301 RepID=UPI00064F814C|nr:MULTISPECIES: aspartate--tRNA(Asn) ligase [unclassified Acidiplasma]WMT54653.1 MAG: aspartate--tRNA(Asn) ligase [Acidiplasma sp.]